MKPDLFFLILAASLCAAKPHYVDFVNGSDAAGGDSPSDPWKHCPGDENATAGARSTTLSPGDIVYFRGGIVYRGQIALPWSGQNGAPVVYDGNSSGQWGWDKAIVDGENTRSGGFVSSARSISNVIVRNFEIRAIKYTGVEWAGGSGIKIDNADHVTVADCFIHEVGYWGNDGSIVPAGSGINMVQPLHCVISGNEITKTGLAGIQLSGAQSTIILHNNIHDYVTWGVDLAGDYQVCARNTVCDNTIHDLFHYDNGFWKGAGDPPHSDFLFIRKGSGFHPVNNVVERNLFYNDGAFTEFGGTAMLFLSYADSTVIRNNVFVNAHSYSTVYFGWTSTGTQFCNNAVYCPRTGALRLSTGGDNIVQNNIFVAHSTGITYDSVSDERNLVIDHNLYCMPNDGKVFARIVPWCGWNFSAWQGRGYDAHSKLLSSVSLFRFVTVDGYPLQCRAMNLRLLPGSPAIRAGIKVEGFADDMSGRDRSQTSAWDIGPFAFVPKSGDSLTTRAAQGQRKQKE